MITEVGAENNTTTIVLMPSDFVTAAKEFLIRKILQPNQIFSMIRRILTQTTPQEKLPWP